MLKQCLILVVCIKTNTQCFCPSWTHTGTLLCHPKKIPLANSRFKVSLPLPKKKNREEEVVYARFLVLICSTLLHFFLPLSPPLLSLFGHVPPTLPFFVPSTPQK